MATNRFKVKLGLDNNDQTITNVADPVNVQDAATRAYVLANTGVTSFTGGTTGLLPSSATTGAISLSGTLAIANGGTGETTNAAAYTALVGYTTVVTSATTVTLDNTSENLYYFTGASAQTVVLPVVTTLALGWSFNITNNSTAGTLTINSSGANLVCTIPFSMTAMVTCILITGTDAASWDYGYTDFASITGTGSAVLATSPTVTSLSLAAAVGTAVGTAPLYIMPGTTVLAAAAVGAFESDAAMPYYTNNTTNGRGFIPNIHTYRLTTAGTQIVATAANFFGANSNIPLVPGGFYEIDIYAIGLKGNSPGACIWTFTNTVAPTLMIIEYEQTQLAGAVAVPTTAALTNLSLKGFYSSTAISTTITTGSLAVNVNHCFKIKIFLNNATGTSLKILFTAGATAAGVTPQAGSVWFAKRLPATNTGAFAA